MIRVALLGSDSTHVEAFTQRMNRPGAPFYGIAEVISLYGEDRREAEEKAAMFGVSRVAANVADALEGADLAIVAGRFADSHYGPASIALRRGIPTFVDKPFTSTGDEARDLCALAARHRTPLCSCSPLRFAREVISLREQMQRASFAWDGLTITAPAECLDLGADPRLHAPLFYGIHGAEMLFELVALQASDFIVSRDARAITARALYGRRTVALELLHGIDEAYCVVLDTSGHECGTSVELDGSYYTALLDEVLVRFTDGTGRLKVDSAVQSIALMDRMSPSHP